MHPVLPTAGTGSSAGGFGMIGISSESTKYKYKSSLFPIYTISPGLCVRIAKVFDLPPEEVFTAAGLLPHSIPILLSDTICRKFVLLNKEYQELTIGFIDMLIERQGK